MALVGFNGEPFTVGEGTVGESERPRLRGNLQALWDIMPANKRTVFLLTMRLDAAGVPEGPSCRERMASVPERHQEMATVLMTSLMDADMTTVPDDVVAYLGLASS